MKRKFFVLVAGLFLSISGYTQKKIVDVYSWREMEWIEPGQVDISPDGKYCVYAVNNNVSPNNAAKLLTTDGKKEVALGEVAGRLSFSSDSKFLTYNLPGDTLAIRRLLDNNLHLIPGVKQVRLIKNRNKSIAIYLTKSDSLFIRELLTGKEQVISHVHEFGMADGSNTIWLQSEKAFRRLNLTTGNIDPVFVGETGPSAVDISGDQLGFIAKQADTWQLFLAGNTGTAHCLSCTSNVQIAERNPVFSKDGKLLYFGLTATEKLPAKDEDVLTDKVNIWNYKDKIIMSRQLYEQKHKESGEWRAVINLSAGKMKIIEDNDWELASSLNNRYILLKTKNNRDAEGFFNEEQKTRYRLLDLVSGGVDDLGTTYHLISPEEKHLTVFNEVERQMCIIEIATGRKIYPLAAMELPMDITYQNGNGNSSSFHPHPKWLKGEQTILMRDKYDIWKIDLNNPNAPVNLTKGEGRKRGICFNYKRDDDEALSKQTKLVLMGRNLDNNDAGFAVVDFQNDNFVLGAFGPYFYCWPTLNAMSLFRKAADTDVFLVSRQSASSSLNIFLTRDFIHYKPLTEIHPERKFNWITAELVNYPMKGGSMGKGILYKPENFDATKKYPIIFHYYQERNEELHHFLPPQAGVNLCIPLYVSQGYLVFVADIQNTLPGGIVGRTVNSVVSAANYLTSRYSWIDGAHMGLQGHSFGGFETNLLIANTDIFAAANAEAGVSNLVSEMGDLAFGDNELHTMTETGQFNLRTNIWKDPDVYFNASAVLKADKITTPLLLFHCRADYNVPFGQSVEMFTALRRLGKPVWMLEYDDFGHSTTGCNDPGSVDLNIRKLQFFDHYLKGKPAPVWMTRGVPAKYKGIKSGLQLEQEAAKP